MKELLKKFEEAMMAVTFAEEGEFEEARAIVNAERKEADRPAVDRPAATNGTILRAG